MRPSKVVPVTPQTGNPFFVHAWPIIHWRGWAKKASGDQLNIILLRRWTRSKTYHGAGRGLCSPGVGRGAEPQDTNFAPACALASCSPPLPGGKATKASEPIMAERMWPWGAEIRREDHGISSERGSKRTVRQRSKCGLPRAVVPDEI